MKQFPTIEGRQCICECCIVKNECNDDHKPFGCDDFDYDPALCKDCAYECAIFSEPIDPED